jgi:cell division protein FtsL
MFSRSFNQSSWGPRNLLDKAKNILLSSQGFPIFLTLIVLAILFVLFRMKSVELDYKIIEVNKDIKKMQLKNKELEARKARLLSTRRLRRLAKKYKLSQPKQDQIIVIP